ncbi:hypothetical protein MA16_Dca009077 [Dendrobium catenatum]|uniref:Uncharacterized protein n=1 Tax=Dendrobium catenatum TaxID=906689 RepID=A0A2I0VRF9_9ASPA|nr:hypothetical protein MA16_Dca009077 [Dendrobium catenatum]
MIGSLTSPSTQQALRKAVVEEPPSQQPGDEELSNLSSPDLMNSSDSDQSLLKWLRINILPIFGTINQIRNLQILQQICNAQSEDQRNFSSTSPLKHKAKNRRNYHTVHTKPKVEPKGFVINKSAMHKALDR